MSTPHEQPEYGERATPEQQAEAIRASGGVPEAQRAAEFQPAVQRATGSPSPSSRYLVNRFITVFLLGVGLVAVIQSVFGYLNLAESIQTLYTQQGIGTYTETPLTSTIGIALVITHAVIWVATAWISMRVLATGRTAWWIPLIGAVLSFAVMAVLMAIVLLADPAFMQYIGVGT